jgi:hypothetical protein
MPIGYASQPATQHPTQYTATGYPGYAVVPPATYVAKPVAITWDRSFEGKPEEDIGLFLEEFELYCKVSRIPGEVWVNLLRLKLNGTARETIASLPYEDKEDYATVRITLIKEFGNEDQYLTARNQIMNKKYSGSVKDLIRELTSLIRKAYPTHSQEFRNEMLYSTVMEKLPRDLAFELRRQECNSVANLSREAPKMEALLREFKATNPRYEALPVMAVAEANPTTHNAYRQLQLPSPDDNYEDEEQSPAPYRNEYQGSRQRRYCEICNQAGHTTRKCWYNPRNQPEQFDNEQETEGRLICCFCSEPGHGGMYCPYRTQTQHNRILNETYDVTNQMAALQFQPQQHYQQPTPANPSQQTLGQTMRTANHPPGNPTTNGQQAPQYHHVGGISLTGWSANKSTTLPMETVSQSPPMKPYEDPTQQSFKRPISAPSDKTKETEQANHKCNLCRRRGHKSSNCWFNQNSNNFDPNAKKGPSQIPNRTSIKHLIKQVFDAKHKDNPDAKLCYRCTEEGHSAKECPTYPKRSNQHDDVHGRPAAAGR